MNIVKCTDCGNEYNDDYPALGRLSQKMDIPLCPLCQVLIEGAEAEEMLAEYAEAAELNRALAEEHMAAFDEVVDTEGTGPLTGTGKEEEKDDRAK